MQGTESLRILIVDDEHSLSKAMALALRCDGWTVATAQGADEALGRIRDEHFDVLVLDLLMPDMRGDALYYFAIASQPHLARATVFVTGDITAHADELIRACGCEPLRKPFDLDEFLRRVRAQVPQRKRA